MLVKSNKLIGLRLGVNGVFGNFGVAAALITGTAYNWRLAALFHIPGLFCVAYGVAFARLSKMMKLYSKSRVSAAGPCSTGSEHWLHWLNNIKRRFYFWGNDVCCAALF